MEENTPMPEDSAVTLAPDTEGAEAGRTAGPPQAVPFVRFTAWSLVVGPLTLAAAGLVHPASPGRTRAPSLPPSVHKVPRGRRGRRCCSWAASQPSPASCG